MNLVEINNLVEELINSATEIRSSMESANEKESLLHYREIREKPPFYFNKQITALKRTAVNEFLEDTQSLMKQPTVASLRSFVSKFNQLKQANIDIREKGQLSKILAHHEVSIKELQLGLDEIEKDMIKQKKIISMKLQWLLTKHSILENTKNLDPLHTVFHYRQENDLKTQLLNDEEEDFVQKFEKGTDTAIQKEINDLRDERKKLDTKYLESKVGDRYKSEEIEEIVNIRSKVHDLQDTLLINEKDFVWERRGLAERELEKWDSAGPDRETISNKYIPWLNSENKKHSLSLPVSSTLARTLKVIDESPEMTPEGIYKSLARIETQSNSENANLEKQRIDQYTKQRIAGSRDVRMKQDWLKTIKKMVRSLKTVIRPTESESEGDGERPHPR